MANNKWWIFTFGVGHEFGGKYVRIYGTFETARDKMFEIYGKNWAFQYSEEDWERFEKDPNRKYEMETELTRIIVNDWLMLKDVAKLLGLKVRTIRKWVDIGVIKAEKEGNYLFVHKREIERAEVLERADKGREHSKRIKAGIELGMLARRSQNPEKSV